tara:strand:- start:3609 stop:4184 length:576 start_codon:yes stop_codon:yes gene_type:complete
MTKTPQLSVDDDFSLNPLSKVALTPILNAFNEDPESAYSALPWLDKNKEIRQQIRDMLFDVESQVNSDEIHFWSITHVESNEFVGLIGLGDELQLLHSNYNLGYWVRSKFRRQGITIRSVNAILQWLNSRNEFFRIEITVHPHNIAGLATAASVCNDWDGELVEEFIGIEISNRTVPHRIHIIDINRGGNN